MKTAEARECVYGNVGGQKRLRSKLLLSMLERFSFERNRQGISAANICDS